VRASKIGGMKIREAVIVDAVRTPLGRRDGVLKSWHPVDLLAHTLRGLTDRNKLDPAVIDDVICGCVMQVGEQGINVARNAVLAAGFPESVPATTVDRQCGSSQQAIHFAAQGVIAGSYEIAIACGVESMTRVPMGASVASGPGKPFGPAVMKRYNNSHFNQGISAEMMAERWKLDRASLDAYSLESHSAPHAPRMKAGSIARFCPYRWLPRVAPRISHGMKASVPMLLWKKWAPSKRHSKQTALLRPQIHPR
jgi:acetyl-CoA acyltransferase